MKNYQLFGFYDIGKVWFQDAASAAGTRPGQSLASAGFGTRFSAGAHLSGTLEAAWPLTKPVASYQATSSGKNARILASVVARF